MAEGGQLVDPDVVEDDEEDVRLWVRARRDLASRRSGQSKRAAGEETPAPANLVLAKPVLANPAFAKPVEHDAAPEVFLVAAPATSTMLQHSVIGTARQDETAGKLVDRTTRTQQKRVCSVVRSGFGFSRPV